MTDASRPRRVAMLAPMPSELRPIVRKVPLHRSQLGELPVQSGVIGTTEVVATRTGMGMPSATRAAEAILDAGPVDHVLVVGIAGGVAPGLEIGQVLVPDVVVDGHTGAEYRSSPFGGVTAAGRLQTSNDFTVDPNVVAGLREHGVAAVDMETAAIAAVCQRRSCPWTAFRSISDRIDDGIVDDEVFGLAKPDGSPNYAAVARLFLTRPWRIPRLVRVARDANVATDAAASAAIRACAS